MSGARQNMWQTRVCDKCGRRFEDHGRLALAARAIVARTLTALRALQDRLAAALDELHHFENPMLRLSDDGRWFCQVCSKHFERHRQRAAEKHANRCWETRVL